MFSKTVKSKNTLETKSTSFYYYLDILELEAALVIKFSSWHKSQVSCHAHMAHSQCTAVKALEIAETAARYKPDFRDRIPDGKLSGAESSCSSN